MASPFARFNPTNPISAYQSNMGSIQSAYQTIIGSRNPMQAFQNIAMQNPAMQPIVNALRSGMNPQQLFNSLCQQRGINPQDFMRQITGNNGF